MSDEVTCCANAPAIFLVNMLNAYNIKTMPMILSAFAYAANALTYDTLAPTPPNGYGMPLVLTSIIIKRDLFNHLRDDVAAMVTAHPCSSSLSIARKCVFLVTLSLNNMLAHLCKPP